MLHLLEDIEPHLVFWDGAYYNLDTVKHYELHEERLFIRWEYLCGEVIHIQASDIYHYNDMLVTFGNKMRKAWK